MLPRLKIFQYDAKNETVSTFTSFDGADEDKTRWIAALDDLTADGFATSHGWTPSGGEILHNHAYDTATDYSAAGVDIILFPKEPIKPGDIFEDCSFTPLLCTVSDYEAGTIQGISLTNGDQRTCSAKNCGVRKLTVEQALMLLSHRDDILNYWDNPEAVVSPEAKAYVDFYMKQCNSLFY